MGIKRHIRNKKILSGARRGLISFIVSYLLCFGIHLLGIIYNKSNGISSETSGILLAVLGSVPIVLTLFFTLVSVLINKKYKNMGENAAEIQSFMMSHRENAEDSARKELACLLRIRFFTTLWAVFLGLSALCFAFFAGCSPLAVDLQVPFLFYSALLFSSSLLEIWRYSPSIRSEAYAYELTEKDYPALHSLARRAQMRLGGKAEIRIFWIDNADGPIGISSHGKTVEIYIDVVILNLLTEEELYSILLHEFAHIQFRNGKDNSLNQFSQHLNELSASSGVFLGSEKFPYLLFLNLFGLHHMLYTFASSIEAESYADKMMRECPQSAATALLKIRYYYFFNEEKALDDGIAPFYMPESPPESHYSDILAQFHRALPSRCDFWNGLIEKEILSRSASHPTIISRIRALGYEKIPPVTEFSSEEWRIECGKALSAANQSVCDSFGDNEESYQEQRKNAYLEPLSRVTAWENNGKPVIAEEYADIITAMFCIGRTKDALTLAERAIAELPISASHTAYFERGRIRLRQYDPAGLDDIYTAIEENNNYIEEGLEMIGTFCCMTGMQEELDIYREKAITLQQKYLDESMKIDSISQKDNLSAEKLPDGVLETILEYIESVSEGKIEKIYLFRKTVSENFFSSTFVLKFVKGTDVEKQNEIYHHVFRYLDTSSDWQYSLYEFSSIPAGILDKTPEYLVWQKDNASE